MKFLFSNEISPNKFPNQLKLILNNKIIEPILIKINPIKIKFFPKFILKFTNKFIYIMIPFNSTSNLNTNICHFIHANGFHPNGYKTLLSSLSKEYQIKSVLLRQFWDNKIDKHKIDDWDIFLNDIYKYFEENNVDNQFAIGHSIGGNLLLRSVLKNDKLFKSIVLLDPTIFSPKIILLWRLVSAIESNRFLYKLNPIKLINTAKSRKIYYRNHSEIFDSYRKKKVFSKIRDKELMNYIKSIFIQKENKVKLAYKLDWEISMYLKAGIKDFSIWHNLNKLKTPTLIIIPDNSAVLRKDAIKKISKNKLITIKTIHNSTHLFPLEHPTKTSRIILDYFKQIA